jgi:hypothetical protein
MKKVFMFLAIVGFVSAMSSCRKEYNCVCEVTLSDGSHNHYETNISAKKKNAQQVCEDSAPDSDFGKTCTVE